MLEIIIVSWNTRELLRGCIRSVQASLAESGIGYRITVVDNASADGTPPMLRAEFPEVALLESGANLGFAGGNNLALRRVLWMASTSSATLPPRPRASAASGAPERAQASGAPERASASAAILLLNPDTEVVGAAIPELVRYLEEHPDVAVVGPQLRYADGSAQPSRRRFPQRLTYFWESTPLAQIWPENPWARRYRMADLPDTVEQRVGWLVGAALLVRRDAIERAGLLDAGFHMYSEELEWQARIVAGGGKIVYLPQAVITHHEGKSSEQAPARKVIGFQRSRVREAGMRYGPRFAALLRWTLRAMYAAELGVESVKWLAGHKRALRAARVRLYAQVVREL